MIYTKTPGQLFYEACYFTTSGWDDADQLAWEERARRYEESKDADERHPEWDACKK